MNSTYTFFDGLVMSGFSMLVVFIVLAILAFLIELLGRIVKTEAVIEQPIVSTDDSEELLVAKIVASCLFQKEQGQNVIIKSIKRVQ